jgi:chromosome partitioning protein
MARVISICNQKGGVGKTTTTVNLGAYLAAMGKYVLIVDLDSQANATIGIGINLKPDHLNIYHSLVIDHNVETIIKKTQIFGFDILPSAQSLAGATVELVTMEERENRLKKVLNPIRTNYDYILIDCPPSLGLLTVNALSASEYVIIPVQCEYFALEGLSQLLNTIDLVRQGLNPDLQVLGVLLTMYDKRNQLSRQVVNEVNKNFPGRVFDTVIPRLVSLAEAPSYGKTILQFDPGSRAARAYRQLAEEILRLTF